MPKRRPVITGLGVVTAAGIGAEALWEALIRAKTCVGPITRFDTSNFPCGIGGEIADFSARPFVPKNYRKAVKLMARDIELAVAGADLAVKDAGLTTRSDGADEVSIDPGRFGCNIGAGLICTDLDELGTALVTALTDGKLDLKRWGAEGMGNLTPLWLLKYLPNMLACHVTIIHGCEGPSNAITCGAASGILAVGEAGRWIQRDAADAALAGGAESKLDPMAMMRQSLLGRLSTASGDDPAAFCRPFDAAHSGTVIGEGGALILLEEHDHAQKRGARIYAELVGFGGACDGGAIDVSRPTTGSLDIAARAALADAGLEGEDIDVIFAYGTGVPGEDAAESAAWAAALGDHAANIPTVSLTGSIGSLFAGNGAVQVAAAAMTLYKQVIPASVNFADAQEGLKLAPLTGRMAGDFEHALVGGFSVGGQSAVCVLKKDPAARAKG